MTGSTESKHANMLRELGFEKLERAEGTSSVEYSLVESEHAPEKRSVPMFTPPSELPCFFATGGFLTMTCVVDETEQMWILLGKSIDMTIYGFSPAFQSHPLQ